MFSDFTEKAYVAQLRRAREHWSFRLFREAPHEGRVVLWRHDVDFSPHRALRLAELEAEENVRATYFVHFHNLFYNMMEQVVVAKFRQIAALGHEIGIHFDPEFYGSRLDTIERLEHFLKFEVTMLEELLEVRVQSLSFHNPGVGPWLQYDQDMIAGLQNAYGRTLKSQFQYVSDSNFCWRHKSLEEVLGDTDVEKLHVLTHPECWQAEALSPRQRVMRCIDGRSKAVWAEWDKQLSNSGRITPD